jgi:hypothetical protein
MTVSDLVPLGIDISKSSFDVALLKGSKRTRRSQFENTATGFAELSQWLQSQRVWNRYMAAWKPLTSMAMPSRAIFTSKDIG